MTDKVETIGVKFDDSKAKWRLIYWQSLEDVSHVLETGVDKYGFKNYLNLPEFRLTDALMRHYVAHMNGEYYDLESGYPHMAHIIANAMMIMENMDNQAGLNKSRLTEYF